MKAPPALARLVTASRQLGADPTLVLHGGGNSSMKSRGRDLTGGPIDILYVKGSGRDMGEVEARDFPALRLASLRALSALPALSDADMVRTLNAARLDPDAPSPSVETLLHAFLPAKFVLHTHANAVLALTNQKSGAALCRATFGKGVLIAPYAMSGFALAKRAEALAAEDPTAWALVVLKHGIFTFGNTAEQAYERMMRAVRLAERKVGKTPKAVVKKAALAAEDIAPMLRGALATRAGDEPWRRMIVAVRDTPAVRAFVDSKTLRRAASAGPATPDHVIWIKPRPLILNSLASDDVKASVAAYGDEYRAYVARHKGRRAEVASPLDPLPRVALVPGFGLLAFGRTDQEARIAADEAEANVAVITAAERLGRFTPVDEGDLFDIEYWGPEQAKRLRRQASAPPALQGQVALVTGGGSGIGAATAKMFAEAGASVVVLDLNLDAAEAVAAPLGGLGVGCDVTDRAQIKRAMSAAVRRFGGLDILISNAGAAWQGQIGTVDDAILRKSFELNFFAHQAMAQESVAIMRKQGTGGVLLFNTSKQAVNPGANFGPYGLPKAATLFLVRQYALDHGKDGIRANAVNADRIRTGLLTDSMIKARAAARKVSEDTYMRGNLLGEEVTAEDVARAFLHLALSPKTTAAVLTVDGGNIEAALR